MLFHPLTPDLDLRTDQDRITVTISRIAKIEVIYLKSYSPELDTPGFIVVFLTSQSVQVDSGCRKHSSHHPMWIKHDKPNRVIGATGTHRRRTYRMQRQS